MLSNSGFLFLKTKEMAVDVKINTLESEGTVRQVSESVPSVPVNLTFN
jgi:hypothetical protein